MEEGLGNECIFGQKANFREKCIIRVPLDSVLAALNKGTINIPTEYSQIW